MSNCNCCDFFFFTNSFISLLICLAIIGSSPVVGSSKIKTFGSFTIALASPTLFFAHQLRVQLGIYLKYFWEGQLHQGFCYNFFFFANSKFS